MRSPEAQEAFTAFLEKRAPDFAKARRGGEGSAPFQISGGMRTAAATSSAGSRRWTGRRQRREALCVLVDAFEGGGASCSDTLPALKSSTIVSSVFASGLQSTDCSQFLSSSALTAAISAALVQLMSSAAAGTAHTARRQTKSERTGAHVLPHCPKLPRGADAVVRLEECSVCAAAATSTARRGRRRRHLHVALIAPLQIGEPSQRRRARRSGHGAGLEVLDGGIQGSPTTTGMGRRPPYTRQA